MSDLYAYSSAADHQDHMYAATHVHEPYGTQPMLPIA